MVDEKKRKRRTRGRFPGFRASVDNAKGPRSCHDTPEHLPARCSRIGRQAIIRTKTNEQKFRSPPLVSSVSAAPDGRATGCWIAVNPIGRGIKYRHGPLLFVRAWASASGMSDFFSDDRISATGCGMFGPLHPFSMVARFESYRRADASVSRLCGQRGPFVHTQFPTAAPARFCPKLFFS